MQFERGGFGHAVRRATRRARPELVARAKPALEESAMKLTYDPRYNVAYLRFQDKTAQVETIRISDALSIDLAPDGSVYGIELLNANEQLRGREAGKLIVENEATGAVTEVDLG